MASASLTSNWRAIHSPCGSTRTPPAGIRTRCSPPLLGLVDETRQGMISRASAASHSTSRFPAFWNEFNDWVPDVDHGGNLQLALQLMLLQAEPGPNGKLRLLPTWPTDWDVSFKLHAPGQTVVEAVYRGGKFETLKVTPASRRKDVMMPQPGR